jgi:putative addiction module component (TIGR02574 family)
MEPATIPEPAGFNELSKEEQIRYLQALWDRIAREPGEIPVPESHLALAEERLAEFRRDPNRARPAGEVLDRLAKKAQGYAIDLLVNPASS